MLKHQPPTEQPTLAEVVRFTVLDWILLVLIAGCLAGILLRPQFLDPATFALWGGIFFTLIVWNMLHRLMREVQRLRGRIDHLETHLKEIEDRLGQSPTPHSRGYGDGTRPGPR